MKCVKKTSGSSCMDLVVQWNHVNLFKMVISKKCKIWFFFVDLVPSDLNINCHPGPRYMVPFSWLVHIQSMAPASLILFTCHIWSQFCHPAGPILSTESHLIPICQKQSEFCHPLAPDVPILVDLVNHIWPQFCFPGTRWSKFDWLGLIPNFVPPEKCENIRG